MIARLTVRSPPDGDLTPGETVSHLETFPAARGNADFR